MADSGKILDGLDAGLDLGVIASLLLSFVGLNKTGLGQNLSKFFTGFGRSSAVKQRFGKWFGIGLDDEGELWKITLALLARTDNGTKKVIAINFLLEAMKDDIERNMFRAILIKIPAGVTERVHEKAGTDGHMTTDRNITNHLDTKDDLRVLALDSLAMIILGEKVEEAFMTKGMVEGKQVITPTTEEVERITLALQVIRNQGLGKDSELMRVARNLWKSLVENHLQAIIGEIKRFLKERGETLDRGYPKDDHPSILLWLIERMLPGSYRTPFSQVWGVATICNLFTKHTRRNITRLSKGESNEY